MLSHLLNGLPVGRSAGRGTHGTQVHRENLGLIDPADRSIRHRERSRKEEDTGDARNSETTIALARSELAGDTGLPGEEPGHEDGSDDEWLTTSDTIDEEGDEDEGDHQGPDGLDRVDEQRLQGGVIG